MPNDEISRTIADFQYLKTVAGQQLTPGSRWGHRMQRGILEYIDQAFIDWVKEQQNTVPLPPPSS